MKASKLEKFIEKAISVHGSKYDYSKSKFVTVDTKLKIICKHGHGEFEQTPYKHINRRQGRPKCGVEKSRKSRMKPFHKFIEQAKKIHQDKYDYSYSEDDYEGAFKKIKIICKTHGLFWQNPDNHVNDGKGCYFCGLESNKQLHIRTQEEFLKLAKAIHGNRYNYSKSKYTGANDKLVIICKIHGAWQQSPTSHLKGHNCPKCTGNAGLTNEEFINKARIVHGNTYDTSQVNYINAHEKILIICEMHGKFKQTPSDHIYSNGRGCPKCKETTGERKIRIFLELNNIKYEYQKRFEECKDKTYLPFDFYLPKHDTLIEYDGIQHFQPVKIWGGQKAFQSLKRRDSIKSNFAIKQRKKLIRIGYFDLDRINEILINKIKQASN